MEKKCLAQNFQKMKKIPGSATKVVIKGARDGEEKLYSKGLAR